MPVLDVTIGHLGHASDYLALATIKLHSNLEKQDFIAPGLALYGDAAYASNYHMVAPCKNVSLGSKDACNFYQSQVRIRVKYYFGILATRWAILSRPMCPNVDLGNTNALIYASCKLHNYCIDENDLELHEQTKVDAFYSIVRGAIPMEDDGPKELIGGEGST